MGCPTCLYQVVQFTQPERSQKASLNFISNINWIHCCFLHPYPEFHIIILSWCVLVADEINPVFWVQVEIYEAL